MEVIYLDKEQDYQLPPQTSLCLGMFDGVHLGHQAIFNKAKDNNKKGRIAVLTFNNSPKSIINRTDRKLLTPLNEKIELLTSLGVDILIVKEFNSEFAKMPKEEFMQKFLYGLRPNQVVVGYDYRFGKNAIGSYQDLLPYFNVIEVDEYQINNQKVSSTRIKEDLASHNMRDVHECLNRFYSVNGTVVKGLQNGHKLGFPTANIELDGNYYLPTNGVYIGLITIDKKKYQTMINVGTHPTIDELPSQLIECHIIDFNKEIYGKKVKVEFVEYLRDEVKFQSIDELKNELKKNALQLKDFFKKSTK